ncbi:FecR protein [Planctomycetes bacterium CA13]|uniref:FecR protein n=1 Tax=Novipirellula herctigrandis TaxID=2527986 RepID=A0A5C5ZC27_9BACT|nr:FecR protein [Planctomycetes bacterium CA13]
MNESADQSGKLDRLGELLPGLIDGVLLPAETEELVQILRQSSDAQSYYLTYLQIHSDLGSIWGAGATVDIPLAGNLVQTLELAKPVPIANLRQGWFAGMSDHFFGVVACLIGIIIVLSVAVVFLLSGPIGDYRDSVMSLADAMDSRAGKLKDDAAGRATERKAAWDPDVAVVVRIDGTVSSWMAVGHRLKPGRIVLGNGSVQLEFMSGAVLAFAGPGELDIHSKDAATLISGSVSAHVPERARGFVLNAPDAAIVDLGTEFNVNVDPNGVSEVEVTSGEVELSLLGNDGNTLTSQRLHESTRMRVDGFDRSLVLLDSGGSATSKIVAFDDSRLPVTDQYVDEIVRAEPILYCRFEGSRDALIPNHMSDRLALRADPPESFHNSIRLSSGHVQFIRTEASRSLVIDGVIEDLNEGPYSIEFWMKPDDLQHATCLGVFPESRTDAGSFINVIEIVTDTFMIHDPGAIRFLHRSPPGELFGQGTNAFTPGICVPGQWHHVVAVKTNHAMEIHVNGQLVRQVELKEDKRHGPGHFYVVLGQLRDDWHRRQFSGALDELAIYKRALTVSEVAQHFEIIAFENQQPTLTE